MYGVTVGSTDYTAKLVNAKVDEKINSISTFDCKLEGLTTTDFSTIVLGADFKIYQYDNSGTGTLRFMGVINSAQRVGFGAMKLSGMDYGAKLINSGVVAPVAQARLSFESGSAESLEDIIKRLISLNLDGASPWVVSLGTVDAPTTKVANFKIPIITRWDALKMLAARVGMELYINPSTGTFNMVSLRGSSSSVATYNLTGASTNAYASSHSYTYNNLANDVIGQCTGKNLTSRYQDISTTYTKLTAGDTHVSSPLTGAFDTYMSGSKTINVESTDGWPASGTFILVGYQDKIGLGAGVTCTYTSITATTITFTAPADTIVHIPAGAACLLDGSIKVADNSAFPASGAILIGEELINYTSKPNSTTFEVSRYPYIYSLLSTFTTSTDTTLHIVSSTGFPASGEVSIVDIYGNEELASYTGTTSTTLTGVTRGIMGSIASAHPIFSRVIYNNPQKIHPKGVLVYKSVATPDANSSIGLKGRAYKTVRFEKSRTVEDLEAETSRYLETHRWGDSNAAVTIANPFDYGVIAIGDKLTLNDSTLGWSSYLVRLLGKSLNINSYSYSLSIDVATYSDAPTDGNLPSSAASFILGQGGAKEGIMEAASKDSDVLNYDDNSAVGAISGSFTVPSGVAYFTNASDSGLVFTNILWVSDSEASHDRPVYLYGVSIDSGILYTPNLWVGSDSAQLTVWDSSDTIEFIASGTATNIPISIAAKGTGKIIFGSGVTARSITPLSDDTYSLGSISYRWTTVGANHAYIGNSTAYADIFIDGSGYVNLGAAGSGTNLYLILSAKGSGAVVVPSDTIFNGDVRIDEDLTMNGGDIGLGGGKISGGPIVIPTATSDPGSPSTGQIYYNTSSAVLRIYNGSSWVNC